MCGLDLNSTENRRYGRLCILIYTFLSIQNFIPGLVPRDNRTPNIEEPPKPEFFSSGDNLSLY